MKKIDNNNMKVYVSDYGQYPSTYDKYTSTISTSKILIVYLRDDESAELIGELNGYYKSNICQRIKSFTNTENVTISINLPEGGDMDSEYKDIKATKLTPHHLRILKRDMINLINTNYTKCYSYLIKQELLQIKDYLTHINKLCELIRDNPEYIILYVEL